MKKLMAAMIVLAMGLSACGNSDISAELKSGKLTYCPGYSIEQTVRNVAYEDDISWGTHTNDGIIVVTIEATSKMDDNDAQLEFSQRSDGTFLITGGVVDGRAIQDSQAALINTLYCQAAEQSGGIN